MIIVLKIILCSSLLIGIYYWLLQKEKMYQFNRFYLIFSLIISCTVPFISIKTESPKPINRLQTTIEATQQALDLTPKQESINWINLVWIVYGIVTLIFLAKTIISIIKIKNIKGEKIIYQNQKVLVTKENISPFSFFNTIYLSNNYLINNKIDSRIFLHEKSHLEQKHSIDLLFIEILKAFMWFNPSIYFYKKAIVTNHEFLADESVLKNDFNVKDYQNLILDEIISSQNYNLTHTFNFNNTKKRFIMMNTKKSKLTNIKKAVSIPILVLAFGLFVQKTYASNIEHIIKEAKKEISEPEKRPTSENVAAAIIKPETESLTGEETIQNEPIENANEEKKISDTIRPKSSQNINTIPETQQNRNANTSEDNHAFVQAEFPEGINTFRSKVASNFNGKVLAGNEGLLKSVALINIDENGEIKQVDVTGENSIFNNEISRTILAANSETKWKPATRNGKPVSTVFKLPITMSLQ